MFVCSNGNLNGELNVNDWSDNPHKRDRIKVTVDSVKNLNKMPIPRSPNSN